MPDGWIVDHRNRLLRRHTYPSTLHGALFFADHTRQCIWAMFPKANGDPDPANILSLGHVANPVQLVGPAAFNNDLFYVDMDGGNIHGLSYVPGSQPPTAVAKVTPTSGPTPLTVSYDGTASTDPQSETLTYSWNFGDGTTSTAASGTHTYANPGSYTAKLTVMDTQGLTGSATVPVFVGATKITSVKVVIKSPTGTTRTKYRVNDRLNFSATAVDSTGNAIPAANYSWHLSIHHCYTTTNCHTHDGGTITGVTSGTSSAPDHLYPCYLRIDLTVTVPGSTNTIGTLTAQPQTVNVTFKTNQTKSLHLAVDGVSKYAPFTVTMVMGHLATVTAPTPEYLYSHKFTYTSWSDKKAAKLHHHGSHGRAQPDRQLQEDVKPSRRQRRTSPLVSNLTIWSVSTTAKKPDMAQAEALAADHSRDESPNHGTAPCGIASAAKDVAGNGGITPTGMHHAVTLANAYETPPSANSHPDLARPRFRTRRRRRQVLDPPQRRRRPRLTPRPPPLSAAAIPPRSRSSVPASPASNSVIDDAAPEPQSIIAAPASTPNCHACSSARASGMAVPKIAPIAAGPAPPRNARARGSARIASKCRPPRGRRRTRARRRRAPPAAAADAGGGIADHGDRLHDGPGSDLAERDRVQELRVGHPVVVVHRVRLHQRDDHKAAAVRERPTLSATHTSASSPPARPPATRAAAARTCRPAGRLRPARASELEQPAAEQHEHEARAERRRRDAAGDHV